MIGAGLGVVLFVGFMGQTYREISRFTNDVNNPKASACLGLTAKECVAQVTGGSTDSGPDRKALEETRIANRIGNSQRRRAARDRQRITSTGSTPSSPSGTNQTGGSTPGSGRPTPTRPNSPQPSQPPTQQPTNPPAQSPSPRPPTATVTPTDPRPNPPSVTAPGVTTPPVGPVPPQSTPPQTVPLPPIPPIVPPPIQVCTPVAGVNCPR